MRSLSALATALSLAGVSTARIANNQPEIRPRISDPGAGTSLVNWFNGLFRRGVQERAVPETCYIDPYYEFVNDSAFGESLCRALLNYPDQTTVVDYTPLSTFDDIYTTHVHTEFSTVRITPYTTVTVTASAVAKRDADTTSAPRDLTDLQLADVLSMFRRQAAASGSAVPSDAVMSASFSSACACQTYGGSTVTSTYTDVPSIITRSAFEQIITTVVTTKTAALATTTVTVPATTTHTTTSSSAPATAAEPTSVGISPVGTQPIESTPLDTSPVGTSPPVATPTSPTFSCPGDHNTTVSQMVGSYRYDYWLLCDTEIADADFYGDLSYSSFSECAAACSVANTRLLSPVCEGLSFYDTADAQNNCFLKGSANITRTALGVDSGILQRIAVGLPKVSQAGSSTEAAPFTDAPTAASSDLSSSLSAILTNSSTSISIITPAPVPPVSGRLVAPGQTIYTTYVSDGTTYSTGTMFSTYYSSNGVWYSSEYESFSEAWTATTVVLAESDSGTAVANTTESTSTSGSDAQGDHWVTTTTNTTTYFPGGYDVTQVISNETFNAGGTEIASTATTNYYSYSTGSAGGGQGGGTGGSDAGAITSTFAITSSGSVLSTYTVLLGGGQTSGASSFYTGGVLASPSPGLLASTIINTYGTAYSSSFETSGSNGGAPSSVVESFTSSTTTFLNSGDDRSGTLSFISTQLLTSPSWPAPIATAPPGPVGYYPPGGETSTESVPESSSSTVTPTPFTNTGDNRSNTLHSSTKTNSSSGVGSTGSLPSIGYASPTGYPTRSGSHTPFTNSGDNRSNTIRSSTRTRTPSSGFTSPTGPIPYSPFSSPSGTAPRSSHTPFTNSGDNRSNTIHSSTRTSTPSSGLVSPSGPVGYSPYPPPPSSTTPKSSHTPFTNSGDNRSNTIHSSTRTWTPSSGFVSPTGPVGYSHYSSPSGTAPRSSHTPFTNSGDNWSNTLHSSTRTPSSGFISPTGTGPMSYSRSSSPSGTAPRSSHTPFTNSGDNRSNTIHSSSRTPSAGFISPTGTGPISYSPSSGFVSPTGTGPISYSPSSTPSGTAPRSSHTSFTNSGDNRSGTLHSSSRTPTGTSSIQTTPPPYPTGPSSCATSYLGTTTIFTATTEYGCYSHCVPNGGYGYQPLTFGPPGPPGPHQAS